MGTQNKPINQRIAIYAYRGGSNNAIYCYKCGAMIGWEESGRSDLKGALFPFVYESRNILTDLHLKIRGNL